MRILSYILLIVFFIITFSCKLFEAKDTTAPIVSLTIEGGNEISRGVTLYLEIEDDSKIDYVDIIIDDTTAVTVTANFDTIHFDVTPFADESEHQLYAKVSDSEGNIGESEKLDVVITEFPGWRIYDLFEDLFWGLQIDGDGLVYLSGRYSLYIFNSETNEIEHFTADNSPLEGMITDIEYIDSNRLWILTNNKLIQYSQKHQIWPTIIDLQFQNGNSGTRDLHIDKNYDAWIATYDSGVLHYKGEFLHRMYLPPKIRSYSNWCITSSSDGTIYCGAIDGIFSIDPINEAINDFTQGSYLIWKPMGILVDSSNNIWIEHGNRYNGTNWEDLDLITCNPIIETKDNLIYSQKRDGGLVVWNGITLTHFDELDTPFKTDSDKSYNEKEYILHEHGLAEAPNGDIWMIAGGKLMRYRPSLVGYPN